MPLTAISMPVTILTRFMQWSSAVIVMGITSYFMHNWPKGQHTIYQEVISTISVALFLPAFVSPFVPNLLSKFVTPIDIIFSYLWLTAFIFAAQDYNWKDCSQNAPPGASCALKKANESFMFLAFFFTTLTIFLELFNLWSHRKESEISEDRKHDAHSSHNGPSDTAA